jgi:hypothetical protein
MPTFVLILWLPATIAFFATTFVIVLGSAAPAAKPSATSARRADSDRE